MLSLSCSSVFIALRANGLSLSLVVITIFNIGRALAPVVTGSVVTVASVDA